MFCRMGGVYSLRSAVGSRRSAGCERPGMGVVRTETVTGGDRAGDVAGDDDGWVGRRRAGDLAAGRDPMPALVNGAARDPAEHGGAGDAEIDPEAGLRRRGLERGEL